MSVDDASSLSSQIFAIIVFGCIAQQGYVDDVCRYNGSNACGYGISVGVIAFLITMAFTGLDLYFPNISSINTRKNLVLVELIASSNDSVRRSFVRDGFRLGILVFLWFIGFCYMTDQWRQEPEKNKDGWDGRDSVQAALGFAFISFCIWVRTRHSKVSTANTTLSLSLSSGCSHLLRFPSLP